MTLKSHKRRTKRETKTTTRLMNQNCFKSIIYVIVLSVRYDLITCTDYMIIIMFFFVFSLELCRQQCRLDTHMFFCVFNFAFFNFIFSLTFFSFDFQMLHFCFQFDFFFLFGFN